MSGKPLGELVGLAGVIGSLGLLDPEVLGYFGWGDPGSIISGNLKRLWPRIRLYITPDFRAFLEGASEPAGD